MEEWNNTEIIRSGTIYTNLTKGSITLVFLTLNGYDHGKTNITPLPPLLPVQVTSPLLPQVEFQSQPLQ